MVGYDWYGGGTEDTVYGGMYGSVEVRKVGTSAASYRTPSLWYPPR